MAIKYLAGDRLIGTAAERAALTTAEVPATTNPHWQILGRLSGDGSLTSLTTPTFDPAGATHLMFLIQGYSSSGEEFEIRYNGDTGTNYTRRYNYEGIGDDRYVQSGWTKHRLGFSGSSGNGGAGIIFMSNRLDKEKYGIGTFLHGGAGSASGSFTRREWVSKWSNTSAQMTNATLLHGAAIHSESEIVVLGYNPTNTTGTAAWAELANVTLGSDGDNLSSGAFTTKKYLWVQAKLDNTGEIYSRVTFNNDAAGNYQFSRSPDGGEYVTYADAGGFYPLADGESHPHFVSMFIINTANKEKRVFCNAVGQGTAGAGNATVRGEAVAKWDITSGGITEIDFDNTGTGDYASGSNIKVWGFD